MEWNNSATQKLTWQIQAILAHISLALLDHFLSHLRSQLLSIPLFITHHLFVLCIFSCLSPSSCLPSSPPLPILPTLSTPPHPSYPLNPPSFSTLSPSQPSLIITPFTLSTIPHSQPFLHSQPSLTLNHSTTFNLRSQPFHHLNHPTYHTHSISLSIAGLHQ